MATVSRQEKYQVQEEKDVMGFFLSNSRFMDSSNRMNLV